MTVGAWTTSVRPNNCGLASLAEVSPHISPLQALRQPRGCHDELRIERFLSCTVPRHSPLIGCHRVPFSLGSRSHPSGRNPQENTPCS